ncbi:hypothetical protein, partial [bacterium endosymbiont of Bathymodiolus sp. 5 South]|uniref:hypothetical protein n=1 Tax=bacterium endosymbiont of Bathymodiolus sp. 5 South TaxID=1181670 RepID=UPI0015D63B04
THFSPTWRFFKPSLSPARTRFKEITKSAKLVILLIIPTYAKVSINKGSVPSYHNNRANHQHQKPFSITLSNGDWIRR